MASQKKLIAFSGKIGTGKTTLANLLVNDTPTLRRVSFANALRFDVQRLFNAPEDKSATLTLEPEQLELLGVMTNFRMDMTVRELLQKRGEWMRLNNPGHWVSKFHQAYHKEDHLVVDDLRYPDEAQYILDRGGEIYRIEPFPGWKPGPFASHSSETALDDWKQWTGVIRPKFGQLAQFKGVIDDKR